MFKFRFGTFETNSSSSHNLSCYRKFERKEYSFDDVLNKYEELGLLKDGLLKIELYKYCSDETIKNYDTPIDKLNAIDTYMIQDLYLTIDSIYVDDERYNLLDEEDKPLIENFWRNYDEKIVTFINKRHEYKFLFNSNILEFFSEFVDAIEERYGKVEFEFSDDDCPSLGIFECDDTDFLQKASIEDVKTIIVDDSVIIQVEDTYR